MTSPLTTATTGVKRDSKGDIKKNLTVIVLDKDGKPQSVSATRSGGGATTVVGESEGTNEWMLGFTLTFIIFCTFFLFNFYFSFPFQTVLYCFVLSFLFCLCYTFCFSLQKI